MKRTICILGRVNDTQFGLEPYCKKSSLEDCQCRVELIQESLKVVQYKDVPFLWGYQTIPMRNDGSDSLSNNHPYKAFDVFREAYISTYPKFIANTGSSNFDTHIYIQVQEIYFVHMTNEPPHPYHDEQSLLLNCFDESGKAWMYTFTIASNNNKEIRFIHSNSNLFEIEMNKD